MMNRWMIQVVFPSGDVAYLRRGGRIGQGPIVQFRTKRDADINVEIVSPGLDEGSTVNVVRYRKDAEHD